MYKYKKVEMSIREFLLSYGEIDCQPVGQRLSTEAGYGKKARGIIGTILKGMNLGEITLHQTEDSKFTYESIDGGHRKRYIKAFFENLFSVDDGRYYRDLSEDEKTMLLDYKLSFVIYSNLTVFNIGYIFRTLNETTDVNHQEMLNSYGDIPIANSIRNMVRRVPGINNKPHSLFDCIKKDDGSQNFTWLQFDNMRLKIDEMVSRLYYRYYNGGGLGKADEPALKEVYEAKLSQNEVDKIESKVAKCLDFVYQIAEVRKEYMKTGLSQAEFSLYTRIWLYMEEEYGSFSIPDYDAFYREINRVFVEFTKPAGDLIEELRAPSPFDSEKTIAQQFRNTLGVHRKREYIFTALMWLIERVDMQSIVLIKDKRRFFPRSWRETKLAEQDFKCAVTNMPITMETSEGGHIIAHAQGGKTEYDNLAMIESEINQKMGTFSLEEFKAIYNHKCD